MFYLIKTNLGLTKCINKNKANIYSDNMHLECNQNLPFPSNVQFIEDISINCTGISDKITAKVYCDYVTATKIQLL